MSTSSTPIPTPQDTPITPATLDSLSYYPVPSIADALLALLHSSSFYPSLNPRHLAGHLSDISPRNSPNTSPSSSPPTSSPGLVGPAFTVQFQPIPLPSAQDKPHPNPAPHSEPSHPTNIPKGEIWSDLVPEGSIVVVQQPPGQKCAVVGGIHMMRLQVRGAKALVVEGRVRDLSELREGGMPVFSSGTSIVGAGAESKASATQVAITAGGVMIEPGDIIVADTVEGVVSIPKNMAHDVLAWLEKRGDSEDKILEAVRDGMSVKEAFAKFR